MSQVLDFFVNSYRTPPFLLPIYLAAAQRYGVPWQVLAAINEVESNYGYDLSVSSAGAEGWMQFLPAEWLAFGVDANGAGVRDPYNPADAIFAAARYLASAGAANDLRGAIYAYNHSTSYVESVMLRTRLIAGAPQSLIDGLTAIVDGRFPVEGAEAHASAAVWAAAPHPAPARSLSAARTSSAHPGALAPPPTRTVASSVTAVGPTVTGAIIAASPGAAVVAVQQAEVIQTGRSARLGRFIEVRDAFGDTYTYARLGRVAARYAPVRASAGGALSQHRPGTSSGGALVPLHRGTWVAPGTVLGSVPGSALGTEAHFLFEIRPAGAGPIDPRPVLQAWRLLGETEGHPQEGTQPLFGPNASDGLIGEILLMSQRQLEVRLLSDPRLRIYTCGRSDIAAGRIDRRVLATLDFLLASGLDPTVSALQCGRGSKATPASTSGHAKGDAVTITSFNGIPVRGHHDPGSLAELAVRRLLTLPGAMKPHQIIGPLRLRGAAGTLVEHRYADRIDIGFSTATQGDAAGSARGSQAVRGARAAKSSAADVLASSAARSDPVLGGAQWRQLITRISRLAEPHVPRAPTSAAVADGPSSPAPSAGPLSESLQLPLPGSPPPASAAQSGAKSSNGPAGSPVAGGLDLTVPRVNLAAPISAPGLGALASEP
jgi:Transglycosylase SLT domain